MSFDLPHILMVVILALIAIDAMLEEDDDPTPLDLARPSLERLRESEQRVSKELRQFERDLRRK